MRQAKAGEAFGGPFAQIGEEPACLLFLRIAVCFDLWRGGLHRIFFGFENNFTYGVNFWGLMSIRKAGKKKKILVT